MRKHLRPILLIIAGLLLGYVRESGAWASFGDYTHDKLTDDAIATFPEADYPDLHRFDEDLRDGSETEGSHDVLGDDTREALWVADGMEDRWWNWTESVSRKGALPWYKEYKFADAYDKAGYMIHLYQDIDVPAHKNFCVHGRYLSTEIDDLEWYAMGSPGYRHDATTFSTPLTFNKNGREWHYWLSDSEDDDDEDNLSPDLDDEIVAGTTNLIEDGPTAYCNRPNTDWGTYGYGDYILSPLDPIPGKNEGKDWFGEQTNAAIANERLTMSYIQTTNRLQYISTHFPPLLPDDTTNGMPSISAKIFGPNKPVDVSFIAMENRQKTVLVSLLAGTAAIQDASGTKLLDGGASSGYILVSDSSPTALPWHGTITVPWKGDLGSGELDDGNYTVKMKVKDQDGNYSEERTRTVKYDKTKPTGTITVSALP